MKFIAQGAESKLFLSKYRIIKDRFRKTYRIKEIDDRLRKSRTKREAKILDKLKKIGFPIPRLIKTNETDTLEIQYIKGKLLRNILDNDNCISLGKEIGGKVAILHTNNIIHGDLTTSNMILNKEIYFIDFGLGFFSEKIEDKAVDLHLLKQALEAKHFDIAREAIKIILNSYNANQKPLILERIKKIESRGRYKGH